MDRLEVADPERLGVGQDQVIIGRVLLDGVDHAGLTQAGRLDGDGAGTGADVPDDPAGLDGQLSQGDGAHLDLGDQTTLGPALGEDVVGIAEAPPAARGGRLIGTARFPLQDQDIQRRELHVQEIAQLALGDALVRAPRFSQT